MLRCLLVDDHPVVRAGYGRLIELDGMKVVGEADDVATGYAAFVALQPDVTITDLSLPGASGLELVRRLRARAPSAAILVFSMLDSVLAAPAAIAAGADGFLSKDSPPHLLVEAVRTVRQGRRWLPERAEQRQVDWQGDALQGLSGREVEVLRLLALGRSPEDCATTLHLSRKTVANYQTQIRDKLGLDNSAAMVHFALRHGLLGPSLALAERIES